MWSDERGGHIRRRLEVIEKEKKMIGKKEREKEKIIAMQFVGAV